MVTADEALIVTKGALTVRSAAGLQTAATGDVISLAKGTRVVFQGDEDPTEVVFVTYLTWYDAQRTDDPLEHEDVTPLRGATRFDHSLGGPAPLRKGA